MQILEGQLNFECYFDILSFGYYKERACCFEHFSLLVILTLYSRDTHSSMEEVLLNCFTFSIMMDSAVKMLAADPYLDCKISGFNFRWIDHSLYRLRSRKLFLLEIREDGSFLVFKNPVLLSLLSLLFLLHHCYFSHLISYLFYLKVIFMLFHLSIWQLVLFSLEHTFFQLHQLSL